MKSLFWPILVLALGLLLWLVSRSQRKNTGVPDGTLLYSDSSYLQTLPKPLYDPVLQLVGKPDYILRDKQGLIIPVELKSSPAPIHPWDSHLMQLAAYCHLVDHHFGQRPPYGILRYQNKSFTIPYTPDLESKLQALIAEMRQVERIQSACRSHQSVARCRGCGYNQICDQSLY